MGQDMNNNKPGLVFRCQIYGRNLGMTGGFGAIDCKDYVFYHGLISQAITEVTFTDVRHASTIVTTEQFSQRLLCAEGCLPLSRNECLLRVLSGQENQLFQVRCFGAGNTSNLSRLIKF